MFIISREAFSPRCEHNIEAKEIIITVFFTPTWPLILDALSHSQIFIENYFITEVLPMLCEENVRFRLKHSGGNFFLHMDNLRCDNGKKITAEIEHRRLARAPHSPYSPDLSLYDFWLFGLMKHSLKDREIQGVRALISALGNSRDDLTFEDVQTIFLDWMKRISWVINNNGDYYIK
jgi:hypothetical protein